MDSLSGYIATIVVSLIIGYFSRFLEPKSKLYCWSPPNLTFALKEPKVVLQTNSLTINNAGRSSAEEIEIILAGRPDIFQFQPPITYTETSSPNGEHVIHIKNLGPKEWVTLQALSYRPPPSLLNVRWKNGHMRWIKIAPQRVWPKWVNHVLRVILLTGAGTIVYWIIRVIQFLSSEITA